MTESLFNINSKQGEAYTRSLKMKSCIVMITLNEEEAIEKQVNEIRTRVNFNIPILIVDSSSDKTPEIAEKLGVKIIRQYPPQGYGKAMKIGLLETAKDYDVVITMDCDMTYPSERINEFISLIEEGWDCVSANRLNGENKAMPLLNKIGNIFFACFVGLLFGYKTSDLTTGMRAYRSEVIKSIKWLPLRFFPCELALRIHQAGYKICDLQIEYKERVGKVKMQKVRDFLLLVQSIFYCRFTNVQIVKN